MRKRFILMAATIADFWGAAAEKPVCGDRVDVTLEFPMLGISFGSRMEGYSAVAGRARIEAPAIESNRVSLTPAESMIPASLRVLRR